MEMRDNSSSTAEEQTLTNAPAPETDAVTSSTEVETAEATPAADPEAVVEEEVTEAIEAKPAATPQSLVDAVKEMLELDGADIHRDQLGRLRQAYASLRMIEVDKQYDAWVAGGNAPEAFVPGPDPCEAEFNEAVEKVRTKKNEWTAKQDELRAENLKAKNDIIDQILALAEDTDNVNRTFPLYRELQDKFNAIGEVPPTEETSVWKRFQEARECYSDNLKINKELRDYDFKKNLDSKMLLIEAAIALDAEEDVISAFKQLQSLHDKWRQIGPVAKELREEIWQKFKDASATVNKRYQAFFEARKAKEAENEAAKTAICEAIEAIDLAALTSFTMWDEMTAKVLELQAQWKTIGPAARKVNTALFNRYRKCCDAFFDAKAAYFKAAKDVYAANLAAKTALAEQAEALKDSTEWRKTTNAILELQKQWKTIGAVPKKNSDSVWKRFVSACDYFFDRKKEATSGTRMAEQANLKAKEEIIAEVEAIAQNPDSEGDLVAKLREIQDKWHAVGHVPFRDKDRINEAYLAALNALHRIIGTNRTRRGMERFQSNLSQIEGDQTKVNREREKLARALESRKAELRTYENNLGFLSSKSKSGEGLVAEFRRKIETLKADIASIEEKIRLIDSKK